MRIRVATAADWPAVWPFFHEIVAAGETFTYPTGLGEQEGRDWWIRPEPDRTVVAADDTGAILGTLPEGFAHPEHGYVGLRIMHRRL